MCLINVYHSLKLASYLFDKLTVSNEKVSQRQGDKVGTLADCIQIFTVNPALAVDWSFYSAWSDFELSDIWTGEENVLQKLAWFQ